MRSSTYRTLCALALATTGCGDGGSSTSDGSVHDDADADVADARADTCLWPADTAAPGGTFEVGIGTSSFQPMPDSVPMFFGGQDGFGLRVNVRQTGFGTGDPNNIFEATNPRTRFTIYFQDTNSLLMGTPRCPYRLGYEDTGAGLVPPEGFELIFPTCWRSGNLVGKQVRIEGEILDWNGMTYGHDTRIVTLLAPDVYPDEPDAAGCL